MWTGKKIFHMEVKKIKAIESFECLRDLSEKKS